MLEKIIKIENIKQWQHKGGLDQSFDKLNLIYGRNGSGKSTLCKLFNFINENNKPSIEALKPFESDGKQNLILRIGGSNVTLNALQATHKFQVFNQEFIDNNLYIPNAKDRSQLANYYDFSLGNVSVQKEQQIEQLKIEIDALTVQLSPITTRLSTKFSSKTPAQIRKIKATTNAGEEISKLESQIQDLKSVEHYNKRRTLSQLSFDKPEFNTSIFTLNIESLSKEAQEKVDEHIANNFKEQDKQWIKDGTQLVTDSKNCPFCAQPLSDSSVFGLYQEFISESYLTASDNFEKQSGEFESSVFNVGIKLETLVTLVETNNEIINDWLDRIDPIQLNFNFSEQQRLSNSLSLECSTLIKTKQKDLLSITDLNKFNEILDQVFRGVDFTEYNKAIADFNNSITSFISSLATGLTQPLESQIDTINETELRFTNDVVDDLTNHKTISDGKSAKTKKVKKLREEIDKEQQNNIKDHKDSINEILKNFHSMIRLKELGKDNKGKGGSTRLKYVITFIDKELSVENESENKHIFEHILSLGDRAALALAFFLSRFSRTNDDNSIIILDDPMSSLDSYRKDATIIEIEKLVNNNYQAIVFSHDAFFLSDIYKHSILSQHTKCFEIEVSYKDSNPLAPDSSKYISSKLVDRVNYDSYVLHSYHKEYNKLFDFVSNGCELEKVGVARSIRPMLEAHLRFLYPKDFDENIWLGGMITKFRAETDANSHFYDTNGRIDSIAKINEFSKDYHHADGFDTKIQELDFQTVQSYAKETLQFITGL
jgi:wobble nucleotide-excising tRNase